MRNYQFGLQSLYKSVFVVDKKKSKNQNILFFQLNYIFLGKPYMIYKFIVLFLGKPYIWIVNYIMEYFIVLFHADFI